MDRDKLLGEIRGGIKLRPTKTVDKSKPVLNAETDGGVKGITVIKKGPCTGGSNAELLLAPDAPALAPPPPPPLPTAPPPPKPLNQLTQAKKLTPKPGGSESNRSSPVFGAKTYDRDVLLNEIRSGIKLRKTPRNETALETGVGRVLPSTSAVIPTPSATPNSASRASRSNRIDTNCHSSEPPKRNNVETFLTKSKKSSLEDENHEKTTPLDTPIRGGCLATDHTKVKTPPLRETTENSPTIGVLPLATGKVFRPVASKAPNGIITCGAVKEPRISPTGTEDTDDSSDKVDSDTSDLDRSYLTKDDEPFRPSSAEESFTGGQLSHVSAISNYGSGHEDTRSSGTSSVSSSRPSSRQRGVSKEHFEPPAYTPSHRLTPHKRSQSLGNEKFQKLLEKYGISSDTAPEESSESPKKQSPPVLRSEVRKEEQAPPGPLKPLKFSTLNDAALVSPAREICVSPGGDRKMSHTLVSKLEQLEHNAAHKEHLRKISTTLVAQPVKKIESPFLDETAQSDSGETKLFSKSKRPVQSIMKPKGFSGLVAERIKCWNTNGPETDETSNTPLLERRRSSEPLVPNGGLGIESSLAENPPNSSHTTKSSNSPRGPETWRVTKDSLPIQTPSPIQNQLEELCQRAIQKRFTPPPSVSNGPDRPPKAAATFEERHFTTSTTTKTFVKRINACSSGNMFSDIESLEQLRKNYKFDINLDQKSDFITLNTRD